MSGRDRYEKSDVSAAPLVKFLGLLAVVSIVAFVAMAVMFSYLESREQAKEPPPSPLAQQPPAPPARLQVYPARELEEFRQRDERILGSYGWVDSQDGIARIPIERAIELLAERGLPHRTSESIDQP